MSEEYVELVNEKQITHRNNTISWFQEKNKNMSKKNVFIHLGVMWFVFYYYFEECERKT